MAADIATQLEGAVESLGRFKDSLDDNNIRLGNSASIEAKINKLEVDKLKLLEKANKAEGKRMKDLASGMGKAAQSMGKLAMKLGVVGGILTMFKGVVDVLLKVDRHAAKFAKQMGATREQTGRLLKSAMSVESSFTIWGSTLAEAVKTAGALAQEFGQISRVNKEMIAFAGKFSEAFAVGTQSSAQFVEHITRAGASYKEFVNKTQKKALTQGNNLAVVYRDLAKNAGMVELYLTRGDDSIIDMANKAATLGKSLEAFDKMAQAWSDVETIGDNIGKTAQLLGPAFEDGLGDLTDLYKMYQNFQDDKLHEKITVQLAKTMKMENGILISKHTNMKLTRAQVEQAAKLYGGDTEFMLRSIKYEKDYQSFQKIKLGDKESFKDMTKEEFGALNDAAREMAKTNSLMSKDGKNTADLLNTQGAAREELLDLATKELEKRKEAADKELDLEKILTSALGILGKIQAMVATIFDPFTTAISSIFTDAFLTTKVEPWLETMGNRIKGVFSGEGKGAFNLNAVKVAMTKEDGSIMAGIKVLSEQIKKNVIASFSLKTVNSKDVSKSPTWSAIFDDLMKEAAKSLKKGLIDAFNLKGENDKALNPMKVSFIDIMKIAGSSLVDAIIEQLVARSADISKLFAGIIEGAADESGGVLGYLFGKKSDAIKGGGMGPGDEAYDKRNKQGLAETYLTLQQRQQYQPLKYSDPDAAMKVLLSNPRAREILEGGRGNVDMGGAGPKDYGERHAKGYAGGRHRGIVGEAGTEVGITRNALRELSSAGIPQYANGQSSYQLGRGYRREGNAQAPGSVGAKADRAADNQTVGEAYRNNQRRFLDGLYRNQYDFLDKQEDLNEKEAYIRWRDQKEFFTKYPAIVDEAIGRPFRESGPLATGIYNSIFSGMQAGARAEFAGASAERQREIAWQHSVAEGLKPGGIVNQGLDYLGKKANDQIYVLNGGLEKEEEYANQLLQEARASSLELSRQSYTLSNGSEADKERLRLLRETNTANWEQVNDQKLVVKKLEKIKNNGVAQNRTTASLLGGIQSGMQAMAGVIASGGSREQALEMGKRGAVGGIIKNLTASFGGQADAGFLQQMDMLGYITGTKKMPTGSGRSVGDMLSTALDRTESTFQSQGRGLDWGGANAQGRVYNSPHLAVVGEGSQNEIIVPTERIRKGLPINEGVARELGSIGVPGYSNGKSFWSGDDRKWNSEKYQKKYGGQVGFDMNYAGGGGFSGGRGGAALHNLKGSAGAGLATAGLSFANTYMETGDMGQAAGQALGAGLGIATTAALTPFLGPFAPLAGGLIGSFVGNKLGGMFAYKPKHGKYRKRAMKMLEDHARTGGQWDHGQPGGIEELMMKSLAGGKKKHPSEAAFEKLKTAIGTSPTLGKPVKRGGGVEPFMGLMAGQVDDIAQEDAMYARYNNAFTGNPLAMAKGGIVTRPTNAIVGEAGPEAVIPLNSMSDYSGLDQKKDNKNMIDELRKSNQQMQMFIKKIGSAKTVLRVDGRQLAETVGEGMWDINNGQ